VDLRGARDLARSLFARDLPALLAERVGRLTLRDFEVEWGEDAPAFFTHAVECVDFREVEIDRFRGRQAHQTGSALCLVRGKDVVVRNSRATSGTDVFLETRDITDPPVVTGNDVRAEGSGREC
jgi:hypothetical protein